MSARVEGTGVDNEEEQWARCLQLIREPTEIDRDWFKKNAGPEKIGKAKTNLVQGFELDTRIGEGAGPHVDTLNGHNDLSHERNPPQWTPDLPYTNLVHKHRLGGGSPLDSAPWPYTKSIAGNFWRRPMDEIMLHLTDAWQHSQPSHLKHLSIIKDTSMQGRQAHFNYRTYENFGRGCQAGSGRRGGAVLRDQKTGNKKGRPRKEAGKTDAWGFPLLREDDFEGPGGTATLLECQRDLDRIERRESVPVKLAKTPKPFLAMIPKDVDYQGDDMLPPTPQRTTSPQPPSVEPLTLALALASTADSTFPRPAW